MLPCMIGASAGLGPSHRTGRNALNQTVELPIWFLAIVIVLAMWVVLERLLLPGVRWFVRRRVNAVITEINRRARLRIPTFSLTSRRVLIDRLIYDPEILDTVRRHCHETGKPWGVALAEVERYAREIIPAFNAWIYFRWGTQFSRRLVQRLYRVRLVRSSQRALQQDLPADTSIVFVMNHRSNMDYVFIAYLAERFTALSYAVGEWARVWPLRPLVRAMGGYFVRRQSASPLYRRVLERYVQMAVANGVTQAVFPEGGLSRDGHPREPRYGLIDYMLRTHDPESDRDILFVPVALNYDRIIEDRNLLASRDGQHRQRSSMGAAIGTLIILARYLRRRWRGQFYRMGYAAASFGEPVSLNAWCREHRIDPRHLSRGRRMVHTRRFTRHLMDAIGHVMPVLPVPLVCRILLEAPDRAWTREEIQTRYTALVEALQQQAPSAFIPRRRAPYGVEAGLRMLRVRNLIVATEDGFHIQPGEHHILQFYANSLAHLAPDPVA